MVRQFLRVRGMNAGIGVSGIECQNAFEDRQPLAGVGFTPRSRVDVDGLLGRHGCVNLCLEWLAPARQRAVEYIQPVLPPEGFATEYVSRRADGIRRDRFSRIAVANFGHAG